MMCNAQHPISGDNDDVTGCARFMTCIPSSHPFLDIETSTKENKQITRPGPRMRNLPPHRGSHLPIHPAVQFNQISYHPYGPPFQMHVVIAPIFIPIPRLHKSERRTGIEGPVHRVRNPGVPRGIGVHGVHSSAIPNLVG
jgi:hypothetical protein